jgi:hypothetical protein
LEVGFMKSKRLHEAAVGVAVLLVVLASAPALVVLVVFAWLLRDVTATFMLVGGLLTATAIVALARMHPDHKEVM